MRAAEASKTAGTAEFERARRDAERLRTAGPDIAAAAEADVFLTWPDTVASVGATLHAHRSASCIGLDCVATMSNVAEPSPPSPIATAARWRAATGPVRPAREAICSLNLFRGGW